MISCFNPGSILSRSKCQCQSGGHYMSPQTTNTLFMHPLGVGQPRRITHSQNTTLLILYIFAIFFDFPYTDKYFQHCSFWISLTPTQLLAGTSDGPQILKPQHKSASYIKDFLLNHGTTDLRDDFFFCIPEQRKLFFTLLTPGDDDSLTEGIFMNMGEKLRASQLHGVRPSQVISRL